MSPVGRRFTVSGQVLHGRRRPACRAICAFLLAMAVSACGSSNPAATFDPDAGQHAANWVNPLSIGRDDFHAGPILTVQSDVRGAVLFGRRCAICHGENGTGKIARDNRAATAAVITGVIGAVPLMKGQSDLSSDDIQAVAAYLATLRAGAPPAVSVIRTETCSSCHGSSLDGGIARISCYTCHNGPDGSIGHPAGWGLPGSDPVTFHGSYGRAFRVACTNCHGIAFGGAIGRACASCHNGTIARPLDFIPTPAPRLSVPEQTKGERISSLPLRNYPLE